MYSQLGINALSNASDDGWFFGHIGAALISGGYLLHSEHLSVDAKEALKRQLDKFADKNSSYIEGDEKSNYTEDYSEVLDALKSSTKRLDVSGHGTIYGALFLSVAGDCNVTESQVKNVAKLIKSCKEENLSRYAGIDNYHNYPFTIKHTQPVDIKELCLSTIEQSTKNVYHNTINHFLVAERVHCITHSHAIFLLHKMGYTELAQQGAKQVLKQVHLSQKLPQQPLEPVIAREFNYRSVSTWDSEIQDEHKIKLAHAYIELSSALKGQAKSIDTIWGVFE